MSPPPVSKVMQVVSYNPDTGVLSWVKNGRDAGGIDHGYLRIKVCGYRTYAHRVAWAIHNGYWPKNVIDHINGDTTDNRIANLRDVPRKQNSRNQKMRCTNTSGHMGVHYSNRDNVWRASIKVDGKVIFLGQSKDKDAVVQLRKDAERQFKFHENHGK